MRRPDDSRFDSQDTAGAKTRFPVVCPARLSPRAPRPGLRATIPRLRRAPVEPAGGTLLSSGTSTARERSGGGRTRQEADELVVGCVRVSGGVHEEVSAAGGTVALEALFGHGEGGHPGQVGAYARLGGIGGEREEVRHVGHKTASLPSRSVPTSCSSCWLTASGEMLSSTMLRSVQPTPRLRALASPPDGGQNPNALPISSCYKWPTR